MELTMVCNTATEWQRMKHGTGSLRNLVLGPTNASFIDQATNARVVTAWKDFCSVLADTGFGGWTRQ